jgi:hypothetical protein
MIKTLLSLAVVAGLVYGAYQVNEKYMGGSSATEEKAKAANFGKSQSFVCPRDIQAFSTTEPTQAIGVFTKGTEVKIAAHSGISGMKWVMYQQPDGKIIEAVCREGDISSTLGNAAPLQADPHKKSVLPENPALASQGNNRWLGNGQMTIQQGGCSKSGTGAGSGVVKIGQSGANKTIGESFKDQQLNEAAPPPSLSPEQGVKERAKALKNSQGS